MEKATTAASSRARARKRALTDPAVRALALLDEGYTCAEVSAMLGVQVSERCGCYCLGAPDFQRVVAVCADLIAARAESRPGGEL